MRHRHPDLVEIELQLVVLEPDLDHAVRRVFVLADVIRQRMRRLRVRHTIFAGLRARLFVGFLRLEPDLQPALDPGRLVRAQETLVQVVGDVVV